MAFYYKGDLYLERTQITLSDEYIRTHTYNGKNLWKYAWYSNNCMDNGRNSYCFYAFRNRFCDAYLIGYSNEYVQSCAPYFTIPASEIDSAIESIDMPIKLTEEQKNLVLDAMMEKKSDSGNSTLVLLWGAYIVALIASLIFDQFYLLWIVWTIVFILCRNALTK